MSSILPVLLALISSPTSADLRTVRSTTCTQADLTRYVFLREGREDRTPCDVLYAKPDEGGTIVSSWHAQNEVGYCEREYEAFIDRLENTLGWSCLVPLGAPSSSGVSTPAPASNDDTMTRRIVSGGRIRITFADGRVVERWDGGSTTTYPDGREKTDSFSQAQFPIPPPAPPGSVEEAWLERLAESLLFNIQRLVDFDEPSIAAYLDSEPGGTVHARIDARVATLGRLMNR